MASRRKEARVLAVLGQLAIEELGDGATPLEWILDRLESGNTFVNIASEIGERLGPDWRGPGTESGRWAPSRAWVSFIAHRMAYDADRRIAEARRKGALATRLKVASDASPWTTAPTQPAGQRAARRNEATPLSIVADTRDG